MKFNFNELKNKTFCIYDIQNEDQGKEVQRILDDELGMEEEDGDEWGMEEEDEGFEKSSSNNKQQYYILENCLPSRQDYKATATQFLLDYAEWKGGDTKLKTNPGFEHDFKDRLKEIKGFKVGDTVRVTGASLIGEKGIIKAAGKCYCSVDFGKACYNKYNDNLELVEEINSKPYYKKYLGKKYAVHCTTQEEWDRACDVTNYSGMKHLFLSHGKSSLHRTCDTNDWFTLTYKKSSNDYTILSVAEFFGEEVKAGEDLKAGDMTYIDGSMTYSVRPLSSLTLSDRTFYGLDVEERRRDIQGVFDKELFKPNKIKKFMTSITKFAKDLTLIPEEKELRKARLKNHSGHWTDEAFEIIEHLEAKKHGSEDFSEMAENLGCDRFTISTFELEALYEKYEEDLLKTAKAYNKEQAKE